MIDALLQRYAHAPEHPAKLRLFAWLYRILKGKRVDAPGFYPEANLVAVRRDAPAPKWN